MTAFSLKREPHSGVVVIAVVLLQIGLIKDVPYTGERKVDIVGAVLSVLYQRPDGCKRVGLLAAGRIERETD